MKSFLLTLALLLAILALLFWQSFRPGYVLFSNDSPFGSYMAERSKMPENYAGGWDCLNWLGDRFVMPGPSISIGMRCIIALAPPKVMALIAALLVGLIWRFVKLPSQTRRYVFGACCFISAALIVVAMIGGPDWLELLLPCSGFVFFVAIVAGELVCEGGVWV